MNGAVGDVLPLALGVAISPIPVIAAILMLLSPRAKRTSLGFLAGWVGGIIVVVTAFTLLSAVLQDDEPDASKPIQGAVMILLGAALVLLAARQWRARPQADVEPALPSWMSAIDTMTAGKALGLGLLLSGLNPKNLIMGAGAGIAIGAASLDPGESSVVIAIFTVVAASTVAAPVIAYLLATDRMAGPLESLRGWLVRENAVVMTVLLLVIGVVMIGKGIAAF